MRSLPSGSFDWLAVAVAELRLDGIETPFQHEHGLLTVRPRDPLTSGALSRLTLRASGVPDPDFAYLDSIVDWRRESSRNAILWLGTAGGIFERGYVALMPSLRWLPVPGANLDGASRGHAPTVGLTVDVPAGWLEWMFSNDFTSGSALRAWSRNLVGFQTVADGPGAGALDYVSDELGRELFRDPTRLRVASPTMYTAHFANADAGFGATVLGMLDGLASQGNGRTGFRRAFFAQSSVWERAIDASLAEMDYETDPGRAIGAFALRAKAVAHSIGDGLGRDRTAKLLATLRGPGDGTYNAAEFAAAVAAAGADIERLVGDWLHDAALPGFVASRAEVQRVAPQTDAQPHYEIRVHVRNDEATPGLVRLSLGVSPQSLRSEPIRVDGNTTVEIGMQSAEPPQTVFLEPYLALNRIPLLVDLPDFDEHITAIRELFVGARPSTWLPPTPAGIVIDDLDPGFSIERRHEDARLGRRAGLVGSATREFDQGLPTSDREPGEWTR